MESQSDCGRRLEAAKSMFSHAGLSNAYWAEAVATTTYLHNQQH